MRPFRSAAVLVCVATLGTATASAAQESDQTLRDGEWTGTVSFVGGFGGGAGGFGVDAQGHQEGDVVLTVDGPAVEGTYSIDGVADVVVGPGTGRGVFTGGGVVEGTSEEPLLVLTDGTIQITGQVADRAIDQSVEIGGQVGPIAMRIQREECGVATGSWGTDEFLANIGQTSFTPRVQEGTFTIVHEDVVTDEDIAQIDQLMRDFFRSWGDLLFGTGASATSDPDEFAAVDANDVMRQLIRALEIFNKIKNIGPCSREALGDRVETWETGIAGFTLVSVLAILSQSDASPSRIAVLLRGAMYTGAIGEGSPFPDDSAALEEALRTEAEERVSEAVAAGTTSDPDLVTLLGRSAQMGWSFTVDGETRPASGWLE